MSMTHILATDLETLLTQVRNCQICKDSIPQPNPVLRANSAASLLIIGQAPGTKVHASGIPWNDASGQRLRKWMGVTDDQFYDETLVAIMPMGFCYPGKGKSGDLPPRPECAPQWHSTILEGLPNIKSTLLIGLYAQNYYQPSAYKNLTERVRDWRKFAPAYFMLPHPSPRNQLWLRRNPWFEQESVPQLRKTVRTILHLPPAV